MSQRSPFARWMMARDYLAHPILAVACASARTGSEDERPNRGADLWFARRDEDPLVMTLFHRAAP